MHALLRLRLPGARFWRPVVRGRQGRGTPHILGFVKEKSSAYNGHKTTQFGNNLWCILRMPLLKLNNAKGWSKLVMINKELSKNRPWSTWIRSKDHLKHYHTGYDGEGGEHDIIYRGNNGCVKGVKRLQKLCWWYVAFCFKLFTQQ